jgi:hypothetical protein
VTSCACVHPCDLSRASGKEEEIDRIRPQILEAHDFFAAEEHCMQRYNRCDAQKQRTAALSEGIPYHKNSPHRGFVEEQPNELFNQLISELEHPETTAQSLNTNELPLQRKRKKRHRQLNYESNSAADTYFPWWPMLLVVFW